MSRLTNWLNSSPYWEYSPEQVAYEEARRDVRAMLEEHNAEVCAIAERKGTVRLTLEQALNVQRALQRAQHLCEESAGESIGEDTRVYTRDLNALGEALDVIGEVCITDEGWLAAAIKEAQGE